MTSPKAVVTVGTFDGVHRGHQDILSRVVARGVVLQQPSVVVTFDPHPLQIVNPSAAPQLLTTFDEKVELLKASGVTTVAVLPFTAALAAMEAEAFVDDVLRAQFGMSELLIGHDHGFGRGRLGDAEVLRALGRSRGFDVSVLEPVVSDGGRPVSSTAIRRAVAGGDLRRAADGLGRPYSVSGTVVSGDKRGRLLGYPTLNLAPPDAAKLLPPDGVYAIRIGTPDGPFDGMLNVGPRPTFGDHDRRLEAHVFDASGDWYGARVRFDFLERLRATQAFSGPEALRVQLVEDERRARAVLSGLPSMGTAHPLS